jgi:hypothetical protein
MENKGGGRDGGKGIGEIVRRERKREQSIDNWFQWNVQRTNGSQVVASMSSSATNPNDGEKHESCGQPCKEERCQTFVCLSLTHLKCNGTPIRNLKNKNKK